jgi:hypothetical protein
MIVATGGLVLVGAAIGLIAFQQFTKDTSAAAKALEHEERAARAAASGLDEFAAKERQRAAAIRAGIALAAEDQRLPTLTDNLTDAEAAAAALAAAADDAFKGVDNLGKSAGASGPKVVRLSKAMHSMLQELNETHVAAGDSGAAIAQFSREMLAAGNITDATAKGAEKLAQTIRGNLDKALADGNRRLEEAKQKFTQYRDAIAGGITRGNTLSDAVDRQEEALRRAEEAQTAYTAALEAGDDVEIAKTAKALSDARKEQSGLVGFLQVGADTAEGFADQIEALRLAGASLEVVQQVAQLGARTGGRVVSELLAGGAEAIAQANTLVSAVEAAAARAGEGAAQQFFGAGVKSARQFVKAIEATIPELQSVLDRIAEMIEKALGVRLNVDISGRPTPFIAPGPEVPGKPQPRRLTAVPQGLSRIRQDFDEFIPMMANGGLVMSPTLALIGEAGPEMVIPLDRAGGVGATYVTVNVSGADPQAVVEALRRYTRANGPLGSVVNV